MGVMRGAPPARLIWVGCWAIGPSAGHLAGLFFIGQDFDVGMDGLETAVGLDGHSGCVSNGPI